MKKFTLFFLMMSAIYITHAATAAQTRASRLHKGMNLSVWLESSYWFFSTTTFPDVTRYTEADIRNLHNLCFQTVRLPVFFEPFAGYTAPYNFNTGNQNVVRGLDYVDSVITWTGRYGMNLVIDNHLADDDNSNGLQSHYQITDANYSTQADLMCAVWRQVIRRYGYADPNRVFFELRNEPNTVSDANLHTVYQRLIDTVRRYDHTHTLIVGNTGYYDAVLLSGSTPYTDTNLIYTFHIYDGNSYPGFCFQGVGGRTATDTLAGIHTSFSRHGAQAADITSEVQAVNTWANTHHVPVWLGEFGCTSLSEVYHDDTSRCNYIANFGAVLDATNVPWCYWDGYGPDEYLTSYDGGITLTYLFSIFDRSNVLTAAHLNPCFKSALHLGSLCNVSTGEAEISDDSHVALYPNPVIDLLSIRTAGRADISIYSMSGTLIDVRHTDGLVSVSTSAYPAGVYLVRVESEGNTAIIRRFVKE